MSKRLLKELVDYWRAQRQAKAGQDSPWLFLGERAGEPVSLSGAQKIYNCAVEKSGVHFDFLGPAGVHDIQRRQELLDGHMDLNDPLYRLQLSTVGNSRAGLAQHRRS